MTEDTKFVDVIGYFLFILAFIVTDTAFWKSSLENLFLKVVLYIYDYRRLYIYI